MIARMIGTQTVWKHTEAVHRRQTMAEIIRDGYRRPTNIGSRREVEEFRIHPNTIKDLPTGQAVLITKTPQADARIIQIMPELRNSTDLDDD
jgi:hypothetical protein